MSENITEKPIQTVKKDKYKFGRNSLKRLDGVHPDMVKLMMEAIKQSPIDFMIVQGLRTAEYQNQLYQQGRSTGGKVVTNCDGYRKKSKHQAKSDGFSHAVDICPWVNSGLDWSDYKLKEIANHIKKVAKELGIAVEWGGDWKSFKDYPHFELKY